MFCQLSYGSRCQEDGYVFSIIYGGNADEAKGIFSGILWHLHSTNNFLLTESAAITEKYQTGGRGSYIKDPVLIFSSNDQADEVNKRYIWLV